MIRFLIWAVIALVFMCVLLGCGVIVPGTPWSKTDYIGPLLLGNNHAAVVERCAAIDQFMSKGPCELAFVDHRGKKVLWHDVRSSIDEYLPKVTPLVPYVSSKPYGDAPRSPYELHILTISPVVVLAVPRRSPPPSIGDYCSAPYQSGCIGTKWMRLGTYWYRRSPMIGTGSFWFSPTLASGVTFLPDDARKYTIELKDSRIELVAQDNDWSVQRNTLTK